MSVDILTPAEALRAELLELVTDHGLSAVCEALASVVDDRRAERLRESGRGLGLYTVWSALLTATDVARRLEGTA